MWIAPLLYQMLNLRDKMQPFLEDRGREWVRKEGRGRQGYFIRGGSTPNNGVVPQSYMD